MTPDKDTSTVLDLSNSPKEAALYFDHVVPLRVADDFNPAVVRRLVPDTLRGASGNDLAPDYLDLLRAYLSTELSARLRPGNDAEFDARAKLYVDRYEQLVQRFELHRASLLLSHHEAEHDVTGDNVALAIWGLNLIDTTNASWEQILAVRRDPDAVQHLRRLRQFFRNTYEGKDRRYVEDDLLLRVEDYNDTVKAWGFETRISSLAILLDSKSLIASTGGALASVLLGMPVVAAVAASAGVCLEMGKLSLHLAQRRYGLTAFRRNHPLAFVIETQQRLSPL